MELLNRKTGIVEEVDDNHDLEWWTREENRILLESVSAAFRCWDEFQKPLSGKHLSFSAWRRHIVNAPSIRERDELWSIPAADLWPMLRGLVEGDE